MKGRFFIDTPAGRVELAFNTWVFKKFAQSKGFSVDALFEYLSTGLFKSEDAIELMLIASEYVAMEAKQPFTYTEVDACGWFDLLGGVAGEKNKQLILFIFSTLIDKDPTEVQKMTEMVGETKKKLTPRVGSNSTSKLLKQASGRRK